MSIIRRRLLAYGGLTIREGLQLWLDAADTSETNIQQSGGSVSLWRDKSGNGNHATQGTGSDQPTTNATTQNGKNVIDFDGSNTLEVPSGLFSLTASNNTSFIVCKRDTETESGEFVFCMGQVGINQIDYLVSYSGSAGTVTFRSNGAGASPVARSGNTNTDFQIIKGRRSGTTQAVSVNGSAESTNANGGDSLLTDSANIGRNSNGTSFFLIGSIAEIIIYNRSLSDAESAVVNAYLANKWGITLV